MKRIGKPLKKNPQGKYTTQVNSSNVTSKKLRTNDMCPVAGIGASAGGLEALESFFRNLPVGSNIAFVVIQHLDPTRKGILPELIQRFTSMKVVPVSDKMKVMPNHVYVIPSNKSLSILKGRLHLSDPIERRGLRLPVDFFFTSLANEMQEHSIGIILSGMGSDGSMGIRAIKEKSGLVLVQDPGTSKFDGMPGSAINAVTVDIIDSADKLPVRLITYLKSKNVIKPIADLPAKDISSLEKIIILIETHTGHDFSQYKNTTLYRRIERRMGICQINKIADYVIYLQENKQEIDTLFKELLIGVTQFFRDERVWEELKEKILPEMFIKLDEGCNFRAWVPGCSTGEEAYTLAIIFKEVLEKVTPTKKIKFQIFATDLDNKAIDMARVGNYPESLVANVEPGRLSRFFTKNEFGSYRINTQIREMVVFATQNITKDPPFTKLDFISCRNMLIYMEKELQMKLLKLFQYCLSPGGFLLLGSSESLGMQSSLFNTIDGKLKIYKRSLNVKSEEPIDFPSSYSYIIPKRTKMIAEIKDPVEMQVLADQLLLQQFAPASVMTNEKGDIVYITGRTGNYFEPAAGKANMNIFVMAREGLKNELAVGFRKAMKSYKRVILHNIQVGTNGGTQYVDVIIQKIEKPEALQGMYMVVFSNVLDSTKSGSVKSKRKMLRPGDDGNLKNLESELLSIKEELQISIEERQTSQEELKSTNEELQSSNEELQSTNEELTTSKEEMQSLNEELQSVNNELQTKIEDYIHINNDLKNLFDSTDIATLFLDKDLNIRRYTKKVTSILKLIQSDIGRSFTDIVSDLEYPDISADAQEVLRTLVLVEKNIKTHDGRWFDIRIIPYRTIDDRIDGLVLTFSDITQAKNLEFELRKTNEELIKSENKFRNLFHEKELILREVHHRIKNYMTTIFSLLNMQSDQQENISTKNVLLDAASRVHSMMILYDKLYRSESNIEINIKEYFPSFINEIVSIFPQFAAVKINVVLDDILLNANVVSNIGIIINELTTNAMKYAFNDRDDGAITISAVSKGNHISIIFQDNGPGIPEDVTIENSKGFGMLLLGALTSQIGGNITIERGNGTKFIIEFDANS